MGGIHLTKRESINKIYRGVQAKLTLPTYISSDPVRGIKPEFIFGLYKGSYGIDIGVFYQDSAFKLVYWSLEYTTPNWNATPSDRGGEINSIGVSVCDSITLKAYLNGNKVTCEAKKTNGNKTTLNCPLSQAAQSAFQTGVQINRELVIAADPTPTANPANVYFYDAYFSEGSFTKMDGSTEKVSDSNTRITREENDGNVDTTILKVHNCDWGIDANGYAYERASCDFNHI